MNPVGISEFEFVDIPFAPELTFGFYLLLQLMTSSSAFYNPKEYY